MSSINFSKPLFSATIRSKLIHPSIILPTLYLHGATGLCCWSRSTERLNQSELGSSWYQYSKEYRLYSDTILPCKSIDTTPPPPSLPLLHAHTHNSRQVHTLCPYTPWYTPPTEYQCRVESYRNNSDRNHRTRRTPTHKRTYMQMPHRKTSG